MQVNGDSIHGTTRSPLQVQSWGESTRKGDTLYLHVFHWPADGKLIVGGLKSNVKNVYLLADSSKTALATSRLNDLDVEIAVPASPPDATNSVVVLKCEGGMATDPARLLSAKQEKRPSRLRCASRRPDDQVRSGEEGTTRTSRSGAKPGTRSRGRFV
jgi:hypothetical protein